MNVEKHMRIRDVRASAEREAARLAGEFARSASIDREMVLAALEMERWLVEACLDAE